MYLTVIYNEAHAPHNKGLSIYMHVLLKSYIYYLGTLRVFYP